MDKRTVSVSANARPSYMRARSGVRSQGNTSLILPEKESSAGFKRKMGIEQALNWAYRDQMVHAALPQGVPVEAVQGYSPGMSEGRFMGDKVDGGVVTPFAAAPDAYAIHAAVQGLAPVTVRRSPDEMEMLYARKLLRNETKGLDRRAYGDAARPEASLTLLPRQIVQTYALSGGQPDRVEQPSVVFERGKRVHTDRFGRVVLHPTKFGFFMLDVVGDDPLEVMALRRLYAVWHAALAGLNDSLMHSLRSITLTGILPLPPLRD
jgi:hypothetical protein